MKINGIDTTSIIKVNGLAFSTMKKMAGVTLPTSSPLPSTLSILNADASSYNPLLPTSWIDFNGHVGTLMNGTTYNSSNGGNMMFDGTDDYITFPDEPALDSQTITMESWVYLNTLTQNGFVFEKGAVNTQYSNFFYYADTFYFRTQGLSNVDLSFTTSAYITANNWYHITCTYGAGTKTIYVNGVQVAQATGVTGTIPTNPTGLFLGCYYNYGPIDFLLNGRIAISRAYDIELTSTQVLENFNAEKTRFGY